MPILDWIPDEGIRAEQHTQEYSVVQIREPMGREERNRERKEKGKSEAEKERIEGSQVEVEMKMDDVETLRRRLGDTEN